MYTIVTLSLSNGFQIQQRGMESSVMQEAQMAYEAGAVIVAIYDMRGILIFRLG